MTSTTKSLGLLCIALVLGVTAASVQASQGHVTSGSAASIFAEDNGDHIFTTNAGQARCIQARFEGTVSGQGQQQSTVQELTLTATYTGCQAFGQSATIDMNGCKYTITNQPSIGFTSAGKAYVDIVGCTSGKVIEITTAICRMTVPQQNNLGTISMSNTSESSGIPHSVASSASLFGITYQADGPLCPAMATGQTLTNGQYFGGAAFLARQDAGTQQATHNGHQYNKLSVAFNLIGISVT